MAKKVLYFSLAVLVISLVFLSFHGGIKSIMETLIEDMWHVSNLNYAELDSQELLPQLEKEFDIIFPHDIKEIKTAATGQSFDSRESRFVVKFVADSNTLDKFLKSFHEKVSFSELHTNNDIRSSGRRFLPPTWFTTPIVQGKKGTFDRIVIYIDTSNESRNIIYLSGACYIGDELLKKVKQGQ